MRSGCSPSTWISTYSKSARRHTARLAGSVQGVVVQITIDTSPLPSWPAARPNLASTAASSAALKRTSIEGETLFLYSTSASASAEPQSVHQ
ncbi:Uncharacterised protein [Vibrio cholerae]|nr:Uncharacterised protein [Vibrio cholerae]